MNRVAPVARSSVDDSVKSPNVEIGSVSTGSHDGASPSKTWKPPALRSPVLILTILVCWGLIAILQVFLVKSQHDGGVLFAPKIGELPFRQQFLYLYLPTVIAVLFSIYWAWIDLETKRMEPYYQLSKEDGALGRDSLLLHYPFDFIPLVPIKAARKRHWPVFWGSLPVLLVTFGLVPSQAGIFSVEMITRTSDTAFKLSTYSMPAEIQANNLSMRFAQSTYGIATLNETLPGFMARNYTLAPFRPTTNEGASSESQSTWTATTTMYSLDMYCESAPAIRESRGRSTSVQYKSSGGCNVTLGLTGNLTQGSNSNSFYSPLLNMKDYTAMYIGYWNNGFADWSLDSSCPSDQNATFYAAFAKNKARAEDSPNNVTAIFCYPGYYQQEVNATVDALTQAPLKVVPIGAKEPLKGGIFNQTSFEEQVGSGSSNYNVRGDTMPGSSMPDYLEKIAQTNVSFQTGSQGGGVVQPMVGLALAVSNCLLEEYLDWKVLSKSYADAYRLLFARAMVDILGNGFETSDAIVGIHQYTIQAVILEPVFTYIVEGLLGAISIATSVLLYLSITRKRNLRSDPSTIASVMTLVADNDALLADFEELDCCTLNEVWEALAEKRFRLVDDGQRTGIEAISSAADAIFTAQQPTTLSQRQNTSREIAKPVRPKEFSLWMSIPFVGLFIGLGIALAIIFAKAQVNGLPLPSSNKLVQNLLENYIPTALATLIEPMWVLINPARLQSRSKRLYRCQLQLIAPQLTLLKALRSKHFVLAAVCAMALLANLLAIAFAGISNQNTNDMLHAMVFDPPFEMKFVYINGSIVPKSNEEIGSFEASGAFRGGNSQDQFLVAESNFTRGTPLPPWTDEKSFYLPYMASTTANATKGRRYRAETTVFGAELDCDMLKADVDYHGRIVNDIADPHLEFNVTTSSNTTTICPSNGFTFVHWEPSDTAAPKRFHASCQSGPSAAEVMFLLDANANATKAGKDACMSTMVMGWIRAPNGSCGTFENRDLIDTNAAFVRCKPRLVIGAASVQVDEDGRLQEPVKELKILDLAGDPSQTFSNDPVNLMRQSNKYLFKFGIADSEWHNDSRAGDYMNYFALRDSNSSRLVDPTQRPPTLDDIQK
ncbi:hypothetical protein BU25DRAFT_471860 [Macroventuria anomochaeta]|uniref:Uncharacterized protein n=1 Tax=Macroventuria anomochaeta TaxID=301207 RepID=A0ACB6RYS9_9PLEO|nr:uncharacterized protein BU25DRAFT_471860 [Macroventuria anomochaeta]KAF2626303.1 hypothetical protein BU25DRAFT_471860 [Macroventuria anomochaeta]